MFVRCELAAVERFESHLQKEYDAQLHNNSHALPDEHQDHVNGAKLKKHAEPQQILQHEINLLQTNDTTKIAFLKTQIQQPTLKMDKTSQDTVTLEQKKRKNQTVLRMNCRPMISNLRVS